MKKVFMVTALAVTLGVQTTLAQSTSTTSTKKKSNSILGGILSSATKGSTLGDVLGSVTGLNKITAESLVGTWKYNEPGISFVSDNLLLSVSLEQSYKIHLDEYGNEAGSSGLSLGLYIWMKPFGANEYGVDILAPDIDKQIYITKDLEYVPYDPNDTKYNQQAEQILAEYKDQIQELMNRAQTMWPDVFD